MHFDHLTIKEGLSHNTVYALWQDRNGYIWIGTQNGLNKYDGYSFEIFRSNGDQEDENGFVGKIISSLFEDSEGNLWVGTKKQGINMLRKGTDRFRNLQSDPAFSKLNGFDISSFFEDKAGNIWVTTVGAGILKYDPKTLTSIQFTVEQHGLGSNLVFDVVEDPNGTFWAITAEAGINYLPPGEDRFRLSNVDLPNAPNMEGYRKILFLDGDYLWIGTEGTGLYRMEWASKRYRHFGQGAGDHEISSNAVRGICKGADGRLYLATDGGGLNIHDATTSLFEKVNYKIGESTALNSNALFCFLQDNTGNLWIGTYNGGLNIYKANKTRFELFSPGARRGDELEHRSVLSVYQTRNGKVWVGTDGGGLSRVTEENSQFTFTSLKHDPRNADSPGGDIVKTIFEDSRGKLWMGTFAAGMSVFDPQSLDYKHFTHDYNRNSLSGDNVWSIAERKDGKLWIGTIGEGISVLNTDTGHFSYFDHDPADPHSLAESNVMQVFIDRDNQVWVGTVDYGLDFYEETTGHFKHYRFDPEDPFSLSNDEIRALFQDSRGDLWIGTEGGGLNRWLGDGRFESITRKEGLLSNNVMGITEDKQGNLWITFFEGISLIDPTTRDIRNFHFHGGENNNQFNQMAILTAQDGRLFFGGINGLNTIRPEQVKGNNSPPAIIFTRFKIFNNNIPVGEMPDGRVILDRPIEETEKVRLRYLDKSFSIDFSAIDFTDPQEIRFSYKMQGFDIDWQETAAGQNSVTYTNLDPGDFTFMVRYKGSVAQLQIFIKPPFWQTLWFKILGTLIFFSLVFFGAYFIIKSREEAHKQQLLEAESQILQLRNDKLAAEVNAKNSKLMFSAAQMAHKNEILTNVKQELQESQKEDNRKIPLLVRMLDQELRSEDYWEEFNLYFNQVDRSFVQNLIEQHPGLTQNDIRLCTLLRINLSTKEIASLLNVSTRAVEQSRYRLKKRLDLGNDDDLLKYISGFNGKN